MFPSIRRAAFTVRHHKNEVIVGCIEVIVETSLENKINRS